MKQHKFFKGALVGIIVGLILILAVVGYALLRDDPNSQSRTSDTPSTNNNSQTDLEKSQEVTKTGIFNCLMPSGDGPHTMECAFGLTLDDGTVYGLGSDDPMLIGVIPTGTRVEVTGALQKVPNDKYDTAGTLKVTSVKQL